MDWNEESVKSLKKEIDESNVSGQAFAAPRTSVTVSAFRQALYLRITSPLMANFFRTGNPSDLFLNGRMRNLDKSIPFWPVLA